MIMASDQIQLALKNGVIEITPFREEQMNPNSYDVRMGSSISYYPFYVDASEKNMLTYGQVTPLMSPDQFGHLAARNAGSEEVDHLVTRPFIDLADQPSTLEYPIPEEGMILYPGNVYFVETEEEFFSKSIVFELSGKSSLARAGVSVHKTAGYSNLGHRFHYILEIQVTYPTMIYPHMRIGQIFFHTTTLSGMGGTQGMTSYKGVYEGKQRGEDRSILGYIPSTELVEQVEKVRARHEGARKEAEAKGEEYTPPENIDLLVRNINFWKELDLPDQGADSEPVDTETPMDLSRDIDVSDLFGIRDDSDERIVFKPEHNQDS